MLRIILSSKGTALVEFSIAFPLFFLALISSIDFVLIQSEFSRIDRVLTEAGRSSQVLTDDSITEMGCGNLENCTKKIITDEMESNAYNITSVIKTTCSADSNEESYEYESCIAVALETPPDSSCRNIRITANYEIDCNFCTLLASVTGHSVFFSKEYTFLLESDYEKSCL